MPKKKISSKEFLQDVVSGMTVQEILDKHKIQKDQLKRLVVQMYNKEMISYGAYWKIIGTIERDPLFREF